MNEKKSKTFKMRISSEDEIIIFELSKRLSRTRADAMRFMARLWLAQLKAEEKKSKTILV